MKSYCESIYRTVRRHTREVMVGCVGVGGRNPIRIQSMTTTNTRDAALTIDQVMRLADAGCEIVRMTVQGKLEAQCCEKIKNSLLQRGYNIPLVADIHFYPPAALEVIEFVDKVRINPGNFVDPRARFQSIVSSDDCEKERIEEKFSPLIEKCKHLKKPIRLGANLGSLSDRIMSRYGNTARGMVQSALEYARICRKLDFHDLIFSMKASRPAIMIEAYRLLVREMMQLGWDYPLHLGVTEAGEGEDGRIKSAMGIGALLMDGLGDTIRMSLTEDPVCEIDPCRRLIGFAEKRIGLGVDPFVERYREERRFVRPFFHEKGAVVVKSSMQELIEFSISIKNKPDMPDAIWVDSVCPSEVIEPFTDRNIRVFESPSISILFGGLWPKNRPVPEWILYQPTQSPIHETRRLIDDLKERKINVPVIVCLSYRGCEADRIIHAAAEAGAILCDRLVEGICILDDLPIAKKIRLSFDILQSAGLRSTKTEFISCPGCGRTLFDLQSVAECVRQKTGHLPGVKIAIMGCIVNGPGEMADADFGLVGSKPGKLDLYLGKTCIKRDIDIADGPDQLVELITAQGKWLKVGF
jgi:(E)-4-hydroxy-3-methylbut-2-enyl-diphosphate synthase